jgi:quercetin dioxygenase-like cupin family protein
MLYVIHPTTVEEWPLEKHAGVTSKLIVDGKNMTVNMSRWEPGASAPEHIHPHEQIGLCLEGQIVVTINGQDYVVNAGDYFYIPSNAPHAERNIGSQSAVLTDFFAPVRSDLLRHCFEPRIVNEDSAGSARSE